jgi:hypothetical protein
MNQVSEFAQTSSLMRESMVKKTHWMLLTDNELAFSKLQTLAEIITCVIGPNELHAVDVEYTHRPSATQIRLAVLVVPKERVPRNVLQSLFVLVGLQVPTIKDGQDLLILSGKPDMAQNFLSALETGEFRETPFGAN